MISWSADEALGKVVNTLYLYAGLAGSGTATNSAAGAASSRGLVSKGPLLVLLVLSRGPTSATAPRQTTGASGKAVLPKHQIAVAMVAPEGAGKAMEVWAAQGSALLLGPCLGVERTRGGLSPGRGVVRVVDLWLVSLTLFERWRVLHPGSTARGRCAGHCAASARDCGRYARWSGGDCHPES